MENRKVERRVVSGKDKVIKLWHVASVYLVGIFTGKLMPDGIISDSLKYVFGSVPAIIDYLTTLAPALIPVGSLVLIIQQILRRKK